MRNPRQFKLITGPSFTSQCASCGLSSTAGDGHYTMYFDANKDSETYKAHYCGTCASMLNIAEADARERARKDRKNAARRAKHQAYLDCGMKRVRGALGGVYYE